MSEKFLEQVESLMPDDALDNIIEGKRALQRFLSTKGVKNVTVKQFKDEMTFTLDDGSHVVVEVTDYKKVDALEDNEVITPDEKNALDAASNLVNDPRRRSFQKDPKKELERALGDMYKGVAKKVKSVAKKMK